MPIAHFHVEEPVGDLYEILEEHLKTRTIVDLLLVSLVDDVTEEVRHHVSVQPVGIHAGKNGHEFIGMTVQRETDNTVPPGTAVVIEFPLAISRVNIPQT